MIEEMYTLDELDLIECCISISCWNHRGNKLFLIGEKEKYGDCQTIVRRILVELKRRVGMNNTLKKVEVLKVELGEMEKKLDLLIKTPISPKQLELIVKRILCKLEKGEK